LGSALRALGLAPLFCLASVRSAEAILAKIAA
jgi:hypothetical protein